MSEIITSNRIIQKPEIVLEVDDFLPPGLIGVRTKSLSERGSDEEMVTSGLDSDIISDEIGDELASSNYDIMPTPDDLRVVSQTIRVGPDGKMVVDVVIESTDFPGITEFEARIVLDRRVA